MERMVISLVIEDFVLAITSQVFARAKILEKIVDYSSQGILMKGHLAYDKNIKGKQQLSQRSMMLPEPIFNVYPIQESYTALRIPKQIS